MKTVIDNTPISSRCTVRPANISISPISILSSGKIADRINRNHFPAAKLRQINSTCKAGLRKDVVAAVEKPWKQYDARLVLADGSVWEGNSFGYTKDKTRVGEVVFNTTLTGYQELLTDPSYKEQIICYTLPHVGNVGINLEDLESDKIHLSGIILRDLPKNISNYRARKYLHEFLLEHKVPGIANVDTRALTIRLRETGCMNGVFCFDSSISNEDLRQQAQNWSILGKDLVKLVTCKKPYKWNEVTNGEWEFSKDLAKRHGRKYHIVAYDYGIKYNILRRLASFGVDITDKKTCNTVDIVIVMTEMPCSRPSEFLCGRHPSIESRWNFLSNGPGDPSTLPYAVDICKSLLGKKPCFGICMGHQIIGQAFGVNTYKLKFGHHGGNHPIKRHETGRIEISSQNHNFAIRNEGLPPHVHVSHTNLNDGTCAGLFSEDMKVMSIQYHPEASPGPHDADVCFEKFFSMIDESKGF